jgi:solute carrier family 25 citrate transporter 1
MSTSTSKPFGGGRTGDRVSVAKGKDKVPLSTHLIAGGTAGLAEALAW